MFSWCEWKLMIGSCLFQFHRTVACWAFAEGGRREEESRGPARAEKQEREGVRQGGDRERQTLQQRILPRTGQEASKTGPRELEGRNIKILSRGVCAQTLKRQTWPCVEASFGDVIVLIKLVRHILLLTEKVRGRVQLRFWPCRVLLIITPTRQMAASRGAQRKHSETWREQLLQSPLPKNKRK